ncbi:hypothetical protein Tco_0868751, partial [Tanacetum coccineum]
CGAWVGVRGVFGNVGRKYETGVVLACGGIIYPVSLLPELDPLPVAIFLIGNLHRVVLAFAVLVLTSASVLVVIVSKFGFDLASASVSALASASASASALASALASASTLALASASASTLASAYTSIADVFGSGYTSALQIADVFGSGYTFALQIANVFGSSYMSALQIADMHLFFLLILSLANFKCSPLRYCEFEGGYSIVDLRKNDKILKELNIGLDRLAVMGGYLPAAGYSKKLSRNNKVRLVVNKDGKEWRIEPYYKKKKNFDSFSGGLTATTSNRDDGGVNERLRSVEDSLANITRTIQEMMVMNHGLNGNGSDMRVLKKDKVNYGSGINGRNNADKIDAQNMFDGMSLNKFLTKHGTVKEYFDSFNSWFSWMTLEEWYRVDLFICGLPLEFGNGVRLFNPKTLSDAYCLAKLQEFTHNVMIKNSNRPLLDSSKSKDSKEVVKNNMRLRDFDDSSKEDVKGKEKYSNGLIFDEQEVRIEAKLKVTALDNNNKRLVICGIFNKEDGEIKENTKSASLSNMVPASGKIIDGLKEYELDKSNMIPLVDEQKESSIRGNKMFPNEVCRQKDVYTFGKCHDMWNEQVLASTKPESSVNESFESDMGADKSKHDMKTKGWEDAEFDADEFEYKIFKVVAYASDVHSHFDKTFTCDDQCIEGGNLTYGNGQSGKEKELSVTIAVLKRKGVFSLFP